MPRLCPDCQRPLKPGQTLCTVDVIRAARQAEHAFDSLRIRDPDMGIEQLVAASIAWVESGHDRHYSPHLGCPFCYMRIERIG